MSQPHPLHAVIVANGEFAYSDRLLRVVSRADLVIAADGGANWLMDHHRLPDLLVGDMDSVRPETVAALRPDQRIHHPSHKDETDTELALIEAVARGATRITLIGVRGGRADHELANLLLLSLPALQGIDVSIYDGLSYLSLIRDERRLQGAAGDTVSLIPLGGNAEGITTEGLEYPLRDETLHVGPARGVSNVMLSDTARVTLRRGLLLLVHTPQNPREE
ncbi:MAG TPA: thiamine diphosphokinase [Chloroflexi bacterium]|nr:thiamine diphosphokinase [Chloroflexota bacterium]